jgi:tripartite-type tricarboxylate transporter receptor subunit TctC
VAAEPVPAERADRFSPARPVPYHECLGGDMTVRLDWRVGAVLLGACFASIMPPALRAQPAQDDFYKSHMLTIVVGYAAGGGADLYARLVARHMRDHLPGNPTIVVQYMPGAASMTAANFVHSVAPKDGSVIGVINRGVPFEPLVGNKAARFDARDFAWIGAPVQELSILSAWHTTQFKKFEDVLTHEMTVSSTGAGGETAVFSALLSNITKAKLKPISGYPGVADMLLAIEHGETDGGITTWGIIRSTRPSWITDGMINIMLQLTAKPSDDPALKNVPVVTSFVKNEDDRKLVDFFFARLAMTWPFMAPPGMPADRVELLRHAFDETMKDPGLLADAAKENSDIKPLSGAEVEKIVRDAYDSPPAVLQRATALSNP